MGRVPERNPDLALWDYVEMPLEVQLTFFWHDKVRVIKNNDFVDLLISI